MWKDNKEVVLASNFVYPIGTVTRKMKADSKYLGKGLVPAPAVVEPYNTGMGGVDLVDQMDSYVTITMRSRRGARVTQLGMLVTTANQARIINNALIPARLARNSQNRRNKRLGTIEFLQLVCTQLMAPDAAAQSRGTVRPRAPDFSSPNPAPQFKKSRNTSTLYETRSPCVSEHIPGQHEKRVCTCCFFDVCSNLIPRGPLKVRVRYVSICVCFYDVHP